MPLETSRPRYSYEYSFLSPAACAAACNQQKRHQKQQRPHRKDSGDQDACPQCYRADTQYFTATVSSAKHASRLPSDSVYRTALVQVQKKGTGCESIRFPFTFSFPASLSKASVLHKDANSWHDGFSGCPPAGQPPKRHSLSLWCGCIPQNGSH